MKLTKKILLGALSVLTFSCSDDYKGVFDKAPDERIGAYVSKYRDVLQGSEHGWMGHYYSFPGQLGAETMVFKFDKDGSYTMNWSVRDELDKGYYSLKAIEKPMISFDTYTNFTKFADPDLRRDGEVEFSILGVSENGDTVFMEERIKKSPFNLIKCKATAWSDINKIKYQHNYLVRERETEARPFYYMLSVTGWDSDMLLTYDDNRMIASLFYKKDGKVIRNTMSINFTHEGFDFMEPVEMNGIKVRSFIYDPVKKVHRVTDSGVTGEFSYRPEMDFEIAGVGEYYFGARTFGGASKYTSLSFMNQFSDVASSTKTFENIDYSPYKGFSSFSLSFGIYEDINYRIKCQNPTYTISKGNIVTITCDGYSPLYDEGFTQEQIDEIMSSEKGKKMAKIFFGEKGWTIVPFSLEREFSSAFYMVSNEDPTIFFAFGELAEDLEE